MNFDSEKFKKIISEHVAQHGNSEFARRAGVDPSVITRYAKGQRVVPNAVMLGIMANAVGVPVSEFYTESDDLCPA